MPPLSGPEIRFDSRPPETQPCRNSRPGQYPVISSSPSTANSADCAIIGAGVIGLAIARRLASAGLSITVFDKGAPGGEASYAAGGMLCPRLEFKKKSRLSQMGEISLQLYPDYAGELEEETGQSIDLRLDGVISPLDPAGSSNGESGDHAACLVDGDALRDLEPGINPEITQALYYEEEGSVDNRALISALETACGRLGVKIHSNCRVLDVLVENDRARGVRTPAGDFNSPIVINSAGSWAAEVGGAVEKVEIRPIKGQMLLLDCKDKGDEIPRHTIYSHSTYLVPRGDGRVIVGTTVEDKGFDKEVDQEAIEGLLQNAAGMFPFLGEVPLRESWAGLRPMGQQDVPTIGALSPRGYFVAVGHYRNGILLAPLTQELMAREILGESS